jgi:hypothetical protein
MQLPPSHRRASVRGAGAYEGLAKLRGVDFAAMDAPRVTPLRVWLVLLLVALGLVAYRGSTGLERSIAVWLVTLLGLVLLVRHLRARFAKPS